MSVEQTAREHQVETRRTARYYTLGSAEGGAREVWFVLHGYGQLAAYFVRHFRPLDDGRRLIVAPEALSRFYLPGHRRVGASWMTQEARTEEIDDYLRYLDAVYDEVFERADRGAVEVWALGFSQGAATASRWATLGQARVDRLVLWAGDLAHDLDLAAHTDHLARLGLTLVVGSDDAYITSERLAAAEATLSRHEIPYTLVPFDGDHRLDEDVLRALAAPGR